MIHDWKSTSSLLNVEEKGASLPLIRQPLLMGELGTWLKPLPKENRIGWGGKPNWI